MDFIHKSIYFPSLKTNFHDQEFISSQSIMITKLSSISNKTIAFTLHRSVGISSRHLTEIKYFFSAAWHWAAHEQKRSLILFVVSHLIFNLLPTHHFCLYLHWSINEHFFMLYVNRQNCPWLNLIFGYYFDLK